jgi:hypothetical protein
VKAVDTRVTGFAHWVFVYFGHIFEKKKVAHTLGHFFHGLIFCIDFDTQVHTRSLIRNEKKRLFSLRKLPCE